MGTTIVFETHATTVDNERGVATGWHPGDLSDEGRTQAYDLGQRIKRRGAAAVFSSDLRRARQTVDIGTSGADIAVFLDWRLRECNYGELNGSPASLVQASRQQHLQSPYPGGESWCEAVGRAIDAVTDIERLFPDQVVVVVGHIATRWALEHSARGRTLADLAAAPFEWQPGWIYTR